MEKAKLEFGLTQLTLVITHVVVIALCELVASFTETRYPVSKRLVFLLVNLH